MGRNPLQNHTLPLAGEKKTSGSMFGSVPQFFGSVIFGIIGFYAFRQAKNEAIWQRMLLGVGLMAFPYFVSNNWLFWITGVAMTAGCCYSWE